MRDRRIIRPDADIRDSVGSRSIIEDESITVDLGGRILR